MGEDGSCMEGGKVDGEGDWGLEVEVGRRTWGGSM